MPNGRVKWFNNSKGYGFILADAGGEDLFVHYSSIQMEGYRTLKAGEAVAFDTVPADRGFHAIAVHRLEVTEPAALAPADAQSSNEADTNAPGTQQQSTHAEPPRQASAD